jgi:hypothetical protein
MDVWAGASGRSITSIYDYSQNLHLRHRSTTGTRFAISLIDRVERPAYSYRSITARRERDRIAPTGMSFHPSIGTEVLRNRWAAATEFVVVQASTTIEQCESS